MNRSLPRAAASAGLEEVSEVLVDLAGLEEESIVPVAALHKLQLHIHPGLGEGRVKLLHVGDGDKKVRVDR